MQSHPNATGLFGKPFPHYERLHTVFGKDKACGDTSEDPADHAYNIVKEFFPSSPRNEFDIDLNLGEENFESQISETATYNTTQVPSQVNQSQRDVTSNRSGKRAAKRAKHTDDVSDSLLSSLNKLGEFYAGSVENIKQLTSCFMHEKLTADRRNQVVSLLKEIEGLSAVDVVRAGMVITKDNNLCDYFFTMDTPELKKEFVHIVLKNNGSE